MGGQAVRLTPGSARPGVFFRSLADESLDLKPSAFPSPKPLDKKGEQDTGFILEDERRIDDRQSRAAQSFRANANVERKTQGAPRPAFLERAMEPPHRIRVF